MSDAKTTATPKATKTPSESFHEASEAGKKVALAYVEQSAKLARTFDGIARTAMGHAMGHSLTATKESADAMNGLLEAGFEAREAARRAGIDAIEKAFAQVAR